MKDAYTKSSNDILEELSSKKDGLNEKEVTKRLEKYGYNEIEAKKPKTILEMVIDGLKDKMILILLLASILSFILGEVAEGVVILIIIFINSLISIIQEKKAMNAIIALRNMNAPHTTVIRGGKKKNILTKESLFNKKNNLPNSENGINENIINLNCIDYLLLILIILVGIFAIFSLIKFVKFQQKLKPKVSKR